jgi:hypothetical protein
MSSRTKPCLFLENRYPLLKQSSKKGKINMEKIKMDEDTAVIVEGIKKSKQLWWRIFFASTCGFILILIVLLCTNNIISPWSLLLCIPVGPAFVSWVCLIDDTEGLNSFDKKFDQSDGAEGPP